MTTIALPETEAWKKLIAHKDEIDRTNMRAMFEKDPLRFESFSRRIDLGGGSSILIDFSKQRITGETLALLFELARERTLLGHRDAMFAGEPINTTETVSYTHLTLPTNREV